MRVGLQKKQTKRTAYESVVAYDNKKKGQRLCGFSQKEWGEVVKRGAGGEKTT